MKDGAIDSRSIDHKGVFFLRIGTDIDGVLNPFHHYVRKFVKKKMDIDTPECEYDFMSIMGLKTEEQKDMFYKTYKSELMDMPAHENASDVLSFLKRNGHSIHVITARPLLSARKTRMWLDKNKIYYDEILFETGTKAQACKERRVDVMIEDAPLNLSVLNEERIPTFHFLQPYNVSITGEYLIRVENWLSIKEKIVFMSKIY